MYLSFLLLATFSSSFIPDCLGAAFIGKCADFGQIDGQLTTKIHWECFPNNTKTCTTRIYDCTSCDGQAGISSLTKPLAVAQVLEPKAQAGRMWSGHRKGRFRFKREVSARRRSPSFGRGEIKDSDKAKKEAEDGKEEVDTGKKETDAGKDDSETVKGEVTAGDKLFTCDDVCLEKNGKYAKGQFEYTSFKDCEGGAKTEESSVQKEEETKDENKNDAAEEPETYEKDKEEKKATAKEVKDEKKEAARRRRMRRFRF